MDIVKVRLRKPERVVTPMCDNVHLKLDEECIVKTERGQEFGVCIMTSEPCPEELSKKIKSSVIRRATYHDTTTNKRAIEEESKGKEVCLKKIKEHNLPMKLVDVEYAFDKRKIIFYFTAEDRVDFRELVRDLAHELKTRIELCHIQVRDEAKMLGGIGPCGLELCCRIWLPEFAPISMKMAKRQNLSLNPDKISGQCGRLMCCLSYENDQYEEKKKKTRVEQPAENKVKATAAKPQSKDQKGREAVKTYQGQRNDSGKPSSQASRKRQTEKPGIPKLVDKAVKPDAQEVTPADDRKPDEPAKKRPRRRRRKRRKKNPEASGSNNPDTGTQK